MEQLHPILSRVDPLKAFFKNIFGRDSERTTEILHKKVLPIYVEILFYKI